MLTSLEGRSVIVTGASKGIGKGIARVFSSKGAQVLIAARDLAGAEATAAEIRASGGIASAVAADVSTVEGNAGMAEAAIARYGGIDILCCNAGIFPAAKLTDMSVADWDQVLDINLKGTFLCPRVPARTEGSGQGAHHPDVFDHWPDHRIPRLEPLWRKQGWAARFHAHRGHRARPPQHYGERRPSR
jgi:3-oxoacyl-[acyl-carrier protein] reductase